MAGSKMKKKKSIGLLVCLSGLWENEETLFLNIKKNHSVLWRASIHPGLLQNKIKHYRCSEERTFVVQTVILLSVLQQVARL